MPPLKLPIDLQSFEIIRRDGLLYVDKTRWIHQMLEEGRYYFMARPRRFGKTLMVSTLRNLFAGHRDLFQGLWIDTHGTWNWEIFPVILLDFNSISHDTPENFKEGLSDRLTGIGEEFGVRVETSSIERNTFKNSFWQSIKKQACRLFFLSTNTTSP